MDEELRSDPLQEKIDEFTKALRKAKVPAHIMKLLKGTIDNAAWLELKLDKIREEIPEGDVLREYDNGGGQKGVQKDPILKAYESVFRDYMMAIDKIMNALPEGAKEPLKRKARKAEPKNALELIREKQRGSA